jgi:quercetin dioxygenase-like cupin family protein
MTELRWWFGALAEIKLTAADTDGRMTIIEVTEPPGAEAPLHVHHREDEAFVVLEGEVALEVGGASVVARPGDVAFGPRDVPHRYVVGPDGCRMLFVCTPGGFEGLVREMSGPTRARALPPAAHREPDFDRIAAVADDYGCELLGGPSSEA